MDQHGHRARPLCVARVVLLGARLARYHGVDRLQVRRVGDQRNVHLRRVACCYRAVVVLIIF